jgi:hypothetical protein
VIALAAALLLQVQAPMPARISDTTNVPKVTLADALKRAVGVDPDYIRTAGQIDVAEWGRRAAILAFIVPSLNVSVDATKYSDPFFNIGIGQPTANAVNFRANGAYEVFSVRKIADLSLRKAELQAAAATNEQQRLQLAFDVENDFYDVLANQALLRVAENRFQRAEEQKQVARARVLSGAAVQTDSLQLEVETTQARIDLLRRDAAARVSQLQLGRRIGEARAVGAVQPDSLVPPPLAYDDETLVRFALEQGPAVPCRARQRARGPVRPHGTAEHLFSVGAPDRRLHDLRRQVLPGGTQHRVADAHRVLPALEPWPARDRRVAGPRGSRRQPRPARRPRARRVARRVGVGDGLPHRVRGGDAHQPAARRRA